ncbi:hypothetical protein AVEN_88865-1 [Araneus ventricosus]|uniref:Uncharacterized protein n=1 Tax=Araneus ventricosus TaxID=182803 RepID=A0A4Y2UE18_ARAVE|nr:hypothetical protein AVEN_270770-1 [Araneus ventricosus]GBO10251.1 hypothetical protein AVEN_88865-1 [Araneus ventricosus]
MHLWPRQFLHKVVQRMLVLTHLHFFPQLLLHPQVIRDTILADTGPLVVYMGVNALFTTSILNWMGSNAVLAMFALGGMCDGSVDVQFLWLVVTWRKE